MTLNLRCTCATISAALLIGNLPASADGQVVPYERLLFAFETQESVKSWRPVNDTVMGGKSSGGGRWQEAGTLEFSGSISLENKGGFASLRVCADALDLSAYDELHLRVRGDGRRYALSVQTDHWIMAGAYYYDFPTVARQWQELRAPLQVLEARSFGRPLGGAPMLNSSDIRAFGFIISDEQPGPFRLEVDWVKAVKNRPNVTPRAAVDQDAADSAAALIQLAINRGVPLFSAGKSEACAAIYEVTARGLVDLAALHLPPQVVVTLREGLAGAEQTEDSAARAWTLRRALDSTLGQLVSPVGYQPAGVR